MIDLALHILAFVALCYGMYLLFSSVIVHWRAQLCSKCGYDLRAQPARSSRCPECGEEIMEDPHPDIERKGGRALVGIIVVMAAVMIWSVIFYVRKAY